MTVETVKLTIQFDPAHFDELERSREAQRLLHQLRHCDEVESVDRLADSNPPDGSRGIGPAIVGALTAEVNLDNFLKVLKFLRDRLVGKCIRLSVQAHGKKLDLEACSPEDLELAFNLAQKFVNG
jgi:hypothetical protein